MKEQAGPVQLQGGLNSCLSVRFTHLWQPQVKFYQFLPKTGKTLSAEQNSRNLETRIQLGHMLHIIH